MQKSIDTMKPSKIVILLVLIIFALDRIAKTYVLTLPNEAVFLMPGIKFAYYVNGNYIEQPENFKFRVEEAL